MLRYSAVAVAALMMSGGLVSGGVAFAQSRDVPGPVAPSAQPGTPPVVAPQAKPRLDAEGYNMDKPAPPGTMGPVKKNPDPSAASIPDMGDAANPAATTGESQPKK